MLNLETLRNVLIGTEKRKDRLEDLKNFTLVYESDGCTKKSATGAGDQKNWKTLPELLPYLKTEGNYPGFHLKDTRILLFDVDGVFNKDGTIIPGLEKAYHTFNNALLNILNEDTYREKSKSQTGEHILLALDADEIAAPMSGGDAFKLWLVPKDQRTKEGKKHIPCIEAFFNDGKVILTGDSESSCRTIVRGEKAAAVLYAFLDMVAAQKFRESPEGAKVYKENESLDADKDTILDALKYIPADDSGVWKKVCISLCSLGADFSVFDDWSQTTSRNNYNESDCRSLWKWAKNNAKWKNAVGTIFYLARQNGWKPKRKHKQGKALPAVACGSAAAPAESGAFNMDELIPTDFTDTGQAVIFSTFNKQSACYVKGLGWLVYSGERWEESNLKAFGLSTELTDWQLNWARQKLAIAREHLDAIREKTAVTNPLEENTELKQAQDAVKYAESYRNYVVKRRDKSKLSACLSCAEHMLEKPLKSLDADPFLLNTPAGTVDLRTGEMRPHNPNDLLTKITAVSPSDVGAEEWERFLDQVTCNDFELKVYFQMCAGMFVLGKVYMEVLIIAYGAGGNGKSTLFNTIYQCLGDYAGMIATKALIASNSGSDSTKEYELAEIRGKRFVLAAELDEGLRLDTSALKKMCSTDETRARKPYGEPFSYTPCHSLVLYTNHLPRVGSSDGGTWSRIRVVPFLGSFRGTHEEIKNYADHLFRECGGAVMKWMIDGAKMFIDADFKIENPAAVQSAIDKYRGENDWLNNFITDCCEVANSFRERAGELYRAYRDYCQRNGDYTRNKADFKKALTEAGYEQHKEKIGSVYYGIELKDFTPLDSAPVSPF